MSKVAKVAISLPEDMLEIIEKERRAKGESRGEFFRRATEALLRQQSESKAAEQYIRGYKLMPETAAEIKAARLAAIVLAEEPWE